ncbi:MAG TPA: hypothetical protein VF375_00855 [Candidatus Limnocylindrales bacterium]
MAPTIGSATKAATRPGGGDGRVELCDQQVHVAQGMGGGFPGAVWIRGADVLEAAEPRLVGLPQRFAAGKIQRAHRVAVIAAVSGDHDRSVRLAPGQVVRPHQLEAALDRLRAAAHRIDRRVVHGKMRAEGPGVRLEWLAGESGAVDIGERPSLALHRIHDGLAAVAHIHDDCPAGRVQVGPPVLIPDRGALGPRGERQLALEHALEDSTCVGGLLDGQVGILCPADGKGQEHGPTRLLDAGFSD